MFSKDVSELCHCGRQPALSISSWTYQHCDFAQWEDVCSAPSLCRTSPDHGPQLQSARAGCVGMRHLHAAAKWELRGSSGVARQCAAGCRSLCTSPNIPGGGPLCAGEHGRDRWRTSEASLGLHWPSGRYRGYRPACCLLLWLLLRRRQRPLKLRGLWYKLWCLSRFCSSRLFAFRAKIETRSKSASTDVWLPTPKPNWRDLTENCTASAGIMGLQGLPWIMTMPIFKKQEHQAL